MEFNRLTAGEGEREAAFALITGLDVRDLTLPADVSLKPPLPVGEHWVTADGASLANGVLVYVHGGGFTHRKPPIMNFAASILSRATGRPALVVHYPLAPAEPFPAPRDAVAEQYGDLLAHVPAERIVIYGESSGAALALTAVQQLDDAARPAGVIAVSGVTDLALRSPSIDTNAATDAGVNRELLTILVGQYLADASAEAASPITGDLTRLPPLLLVAGAAEALLDDTVRFGEAASAVGIKTQIDVYDGMPHAFSLTTFDPANPTGRLLLTRITDWIRSVSAP